MRKKYQWLIAACLISVSQLNYAQDKPFKFIDKANMNLKVKPGDDFAEYSNGIWVKNNPIPAKETRWGSFNQLRDFNINAVKSILENSLKNQSKAASGSIEKRVADFYAAAMDSLTIEKLGFSPIKEDLSRIEGINNKTGIITEMANFRTSGIGSPLYGFYVGQDRKNIEKMVPQLSQGGTSLPDRDYYLKSDARSLKIQEAYKKYIITLFTLIGTSEETAKKNAETIFQLEKQLADAQMSRVEMRDPYKTYNKLKFVDFQKSTPGIDWNSQLNSYGVPQQDSILVSAPKFFVAANKLIENESS